MRSTIRVVFVSLIAVAAALSATAQSLTERAVIPIVGSIRAADGSQFRTSLRLSVLPFDDGKTISGRIIFHPQGQPISDSNPSLTYSLTGHPRLVQEVFWDDVVAAMGQSGIGTMDIVPDAASNGIIPAIEARDVNDKDGRIHGDDVPVLLGRDVLSEKHGNVYTFAVFDRAERRTNVGIRTYGEGTVLIDVSVLGESAVFAHRKFTLSPQTFVQMSVDELAGRPVKDGETILVVANGLGTSGAFLYYTLTENSTNDPTVVAPISGRTVSLKP